MFALLDALETHAQGDGAVGMESRELAGDDPVELRRDSTSTRTLLVTASEVDVCIGSSVK